MRQRRGRSLAITGDEVEALGVRSARARRANLPVIRRVGCQTRILELRSGDERLGTHPARSSKANRVSGHARHRIPSQPSGAWLAGRAGGRHGGLRRDAGWAGDGDGVLGEGRTDQATRVHRLHAPRVGAGRQRVDVMGKRDLGRDRGVARGAQDQEPVRADTTRLRPVEDTRSRRVGHSVGRRDRKGRRRREAAVAQPHAPMIVIAQMGVLADLALPRVVRREHGDCTPHAAAAGAGGAVDRECAAVVVHHGVEIVKAEIGRRGDREIASGAGLDVGGVDGDVGVAIGALVFVHQPQSVADFVGDDVGRPPAADVHGLGAAHHPHE